MFPLCGRRIDSDILNRSCRLSRCLPENNRGRRTPKSCPCSSKRMSRSDFHRSATSSGEPGGLGPKMGPQIDLVDALALNFLRVILSESGMVSTYLICRPIGQQCCQKYSSTVHFILFTRAHLCVRKIGRILSLYLMYILYVS